MKALVKKNAAVGLWLDDVPVPTIGINDVLIKVLRTGICGTDLHIYKWDAWAQKTIPVPMVVGPRIRGPDRRGRLQRQGFSCRARSSAARGTSSAAAAEIAWPAAAICARTRKASASIAPALSPNISRCP